MNSEEAYSQFVDYLALLCIAPFADVPVLCDASCDFFDRWLALAEQRIHLNGEQR